MEMRMIKKEASKTPAYSPRVESHVVGSNSKCSGCSCYPSSPHIVLSSASSSSHSIIVSFFSHPPFRHLRPTTLAPHATPPLHSQPAPPGKIRGAGNNGDHAGQPRWREACVLAAVRAQLRELTGILQGW